MLAGCVSGTKNGGTSSPGEAGVINFADAKHGVRLVYPAQWSEHNFLKPKQALLLLTRGDEMLSLVAQDSGGKPVTSSDLPAMEQRAVEKYRKEFSNFELIDSADTTLGGQPARRIEFAGKKLGMSFHTLNVLSAHNGTGYAAIYMADPTTFNVGRSGAEEILASLEFSK